MVHLNPNPDAVYCSATKTIRDAAMKKCLITLSAGALLLALAACSDSGTTAGTPNRGAQNPIEVGVLALQPQSVPQTIDLLGRVVAQATADVRPEVDGIVRSIDFTEGRPVKAGDVLYRLNDATYKAALDAAAAAVSKADATATAAQVLVDRYQKLVASNAIAKQTLDDANTALLQARADQQAALAQQESARINLDNTVIKAPIAGMIGKSAVSVGSLVTANQTTAMVTIRTVDPTYVDLVDTSVNMLHIRQQLASGRLGQPGANGEPFSAPVSLTLENGQPYSQQGQMTSAELVVSETTGTFSLRTTFPNPELLLLPGMFVRATIQLGDIANAYLVPQRSVSRNTKGEATAYFATADGKAETRVLATSGSTATQWIVTDGIAPGDKVIVDGIQKLSPGASVKAIEVQIGDDGVIKQQIEASDASDATGAARP